MAPLKEGLLVLSLSCGAPTSICWNQWNLIMVIACHQSYNLIFILDTFSKGWHSCLKTLCSLMSSPSQAGFTCLTPAEMDCTVCFRSQYLKGQDFMWNACECKHNQMIQLKHNYLLNGVLCSDMHSLWLSLTAGKPDFYGGIGLLYMCRMMFGLTGQNGSMCQSKPVQVGLHVRHSAWMMSFQMCRLSMDACFELHKSQTRFLSSVSQRIHHF